MISAEATGIIRRSGMQTATKDRFRLGRIDMTHGVSDLVKKDAAFAAFVDTSFDRHRNGDWGDLGADDRRMNDDSVASELAGRCTDRLFSSYTYGDRRLWIITERDRSSTTLLLPEEY